MAVEDGVRVKVGVSVGVEASEGMGVDVEVSADVGVGGGGSVGVRVGSRVVTAGITRPMRAPSSVDDAAGGVARAPMAAC